MRTFMQLSESDSISLRSASFSGFKILYAHAAALDENNALFIYLPIKLLNVCVRLGLCFTLFNQAFDVTVIKTIKFPELT